jgi:hydroxyacylglutathione hydrolase
MLMILEALTVGFISTNCYIVGSETTRKALVIDPGGNAATILRSVSKHELSVSMIIATHSHFDHLGAVKAVKEATGAKFAVGPSSGNKTGTFAKMVSMMTGGSVTVPEPDVFLKDGDTVDLGDLHFEVLYTPGHSPDEICLYGEGILFSGDTLFNMGIGRTDFPGCSYEELETSIRAKLYVLPDKTVVYPGHGPETTIGDEKRGNPFIR